MDPLAMFGDLQMVADTTWKLRQLAEKLVSAEFRRYAAELDAGVRGLKASAEILAASYDELRSSPAQDTPEPCPKCSDGELKIRGRAPLPGLEDAEVHTYMCTSCGYSGAYLYAKPS